MNKREQFKKVFGDMLISLSFKKKGNSFYYENEEILFILSLDKSGYSDLYYIRGSFFEKPLDKKPLEYKYYESMNRWYASFPIYKKTLFRKKLVKNTDAIEPLEISEKKLLEKKDILKMELENLILKINKNYIREHHQKFLNVLGSKAE